MITKGACSPTEAGLSAGITMDENALLTDTAVDSFLRHCLKLQWFEMLGRSKLTLKALEVVVSRENEVGDCLSRLVWDCRKDGADYGNRDTQFGIEE
jgi:hypothetical protein